MLGAANGALLDWDSAGAWRSCSPALQSTLHTGPPGHSAGTAATPHWVKKKKKELTWITKVWMLCRTRLRSAIATGVSQIEQLRISGYLNMRTFLSSFGRKSLCSVTAGVVLGLGKLFVSWPGPENRKKTLAGTGRQHQLKPHSKS